MLFGRAKGHHCTGERGTEDRWWGRLTQESVSVAGRSLGVGVDVAASRSGRGMQKRDGVLNAVIEDRLRPYMGETCIIYGYLSP